MAGGAASQSGGCGRAGATASACREAPRPPQARLRQRGWAVKEARRMAVRSPQQAPLISTLGSHPAPRGGTHCRLRTRRRLRRDPRQPSEELRPNAPGSEETGPQAQSRKKGGREGKSRQTPSIQDQSFLRGKRTTEMEGKLSRRHCEERGPRRRWWRGGTLAVAEKRLGG